MGQAKSFGIEPRDLDNLVSGAEIIVDRDPKSDSLNGAISLQVTDPAKFQHLMDQIVTEKFPDNCRKIEVGSIPAYLMQSERKSLDRLRSGGRSTPDFREPIELCESSCIGCKSHAPGLEADTQYKAIAKLVARTGRLVCLPGCKVGF